MSEEIKAEQIETTVAKPVEQAPAPVEAKKDAVLGQPEGSAPKPAEVAQPEVAKPSEKTLSNLAYIKMRQEKKALKAEIEALRAAQARPKTPQVSADGVTPTQPIPEASAPVSVDASRLKAEIIAELRQAQTAAQVEQQKQATEEAALKALAEDKDLSSIPDGIAEVLDLIDNDPKLSRLNAIDPAIALREAKASYLSSKGIVATNPAPVSHPKGGGSMPAQTTDFNALAEKLRTMNPQSKEYADILRRFNEAAKGQLNNG